jgi:hypothetical protein
MTDVSPWNRLITIDTVIALHKVGIDRYGGDHSPPKGNCLEQSYPFTGSQAAIAK